MTVPSAPAPAYRQVLPPGPRAFSPHHAPLPLPPGHRFPEAKYGQLAERLRAGGWQVDPAPAVADADLLRVHTPAYLGALERLALTPLQERRLGLPQSAALLARARRSVGGTLAALHDALVRGYGVNLAGGTHHAFAGYGAGFCVFNDLAVTAYYALEHAFARRVLIVDLDVHQGDGTAHLCAFDPHVFTFSVHCAGNYPFRKERSSRDVALAEGADDAAYLAMLAAELPGLLTSFGPDLVLYVGGVDVLAGDRLGRLALTPAGSEARDAYVFGLCREAQVPLVYTMGGGYHHDLAVTVTAHARGLGALRRLYALPKP